VVGPALGGFLTDQWSWRWAFYVNIPFGLVTLALIGRWFPHVVPQGERRRLDLAGIATLIGSVVPLLLALTWGGSEYPWTSPVVLALLGLAAAMLVFFVGVERAAEQPVIPLSLFRNRIFSITILATAVTAMGMFGAGVYVPLFVQGVMGATATESGTILMPMMITMVLASIVSGQVVARTGRYRLLMLAGLATMTAGLLMLTQMDAGTSRGTLVRNLVITGIGLGGTLPMFVIVIQNAVPVDMLGVVTGTTQFFRQIGGTVGVALMGSAMTNRFHVALERAMPPDLAVALPNDAREILSNPQALVNPGAVADLAATFAGLSAHSSAMLDQAMAALRSALVAGIHEVFIIGATMVAIAFVACLFLPEIPLRKVNR
jgi:MFS family permease